MADASYDAVIVGGGTKSVVTAMYLAKYAGMSVGIFEERRELCGGMTSEQSTVPGFIADYHATGIARWYYLPIWEDFPDFEEKGGKIVYCPATWGGILREDQSCWVIHNPALDPSQEKTAKELAEFSSERDAETYLKVWEVVKPGSDFYMAFLQEAFGLYPLPSDPTPSPLERWAFNYMAQPDCLIDHSWLYLSATQAVPNLWEKPGLAHIILRWMKILGLEVDVRGAMDMFGMIGLISDTGFIQGGRTTWLTPISVSCTRMGPNGFPEWKWTRLSLRMAQPKGYNWLMAPGLRQRS